MLPLEGVRIIAIEQYGAGPFGSQVLADLGAEIIKIENPKEGGEVGRQVGPYLLGDHDSQFFQSLNRNKKSLTLDLKSPQGREIFLALVKTSDGLLDNLRGDLPDKLGITYAQLKEVNPTIVCSHLSAYGRTGERAAWPGFDYLMQAETGFLSLTGEPDGPPSRFGLSIVDMMTGMTAVCALACGIIGARANNQGMDLDASLFDTALSNLNYVAAWYLNEGVNQGRVERSGHPSLTPSQLFKTENGWLFIMCNKEKFWPLLCEELGKPEWVLDPRFLHFEARLENRQELSGLIETLLKKRTTQHWFTLLQGKVPVAPVYDIAEALENPFVKDQGRVISIPHGDQGEIKVIACPIKIPGQAPRLEPAPELGQHNEPLLTELGYNAAQIKQLTDQGIV
ncbi:MAG: CoA transferase [Gammaproteobacteria bacterium]|nr:MAG: CoA transferase [Gammaproteobacteria bacterium]